MKNFIISTLLSLTILGCSPSEISPTNNTLAAQDITRAINLPVESLSLAEKESLLQMREEEKLAQDVYVFLYSKWGMNIFRNISSSETTHTTAILALINKYDLEDPAAKNAEGVFTNTTLQKLYTALTTKGSASLSEGLIVGATIEDLDLFDLGEALKLVDNQDIRLVYQNLSKGSRNHIRSFSAWLNENGITYKAQYISEQELKSILESPKETGPN